MTLVIALRILAEVHTHQSGEAATDFVVDVGAHPHRLCQFTEADWIEAWRVVRENVGMQPERRA